jgi:5-methylcytosine-specific restriction endonuclease McrA
MASATKKLRATSRAKAAKKQAFAINLETHGTYTCEYCKKAPLYKNGPLESHWRHDLLTVDHVIPLSLKDARGVSNLVVACGECNMKKGANVE